MDSSSSIDCCTQPQSFERKIEEIAFESVRTNTQMNSISLPASPRWGDFHSLLVSSSDESGATAPKSKSKIQFSDNSVVTFFKSQRLESHKLYDIESIEEEERVKQPSTHHFFVKIDTMDSDAEGQEKIPSKRPDVDPNARPTHLKKNVSAPKSVNFMNKFHLMRKSHSRSASTSTTDSPRHFQRLASLKLLVTKQ